MELSAETEYLFRHGVMRDAAYQIQLPSERSGLHAHSFEILENWPSTNVDAMGIELSSHAREARRTAADADRFLAAELKYLFKGGDHARFNYDYERALEAYERLHELEPTPAKRALAADAMADVLQRLGRWEESLDFLDEVRQHAENPELVGRALIHLAWFGLDAGRDEEAARYAKEGTQLAEEIDSDRLRIAFKMLDAKEAVQKGNHARAIEINREGIELARVNDDWSQEFVGWSNEAGYLADMGDLDGAAQANRKAEALGDNPRARHMLIGVLVSDAQLAIRRRDWALALEHSETGAAYGRETGSRGLVGTCQVTTAVALTGQGQYERALALLDDSQDIVIETADVILAVSWLKARAVLFRLWGRFIQGECELREGLAELESRTASGALDELRQEYALSLAHLGRTDEALPLLTELLNGAGAGDAGQVHLAGLYADAGEHSRALEILEAFLAKPQKPATAEPIVFFVLYWKAVAERGLGVDATATVQAALELAKKDRLKGHKEGLIASALSELSSWT